jgi:cell fate regulator YaaT (PSP1 superfamily)
MNKNIQAGLADQSPATGTVISLSKIQIPQKDNLGNAADTSVAASLRKRKSNCSACGDDGCSSCDSGCGHGESNSEQEKQSAQAASEQQEWLAEISFKARRKALFRKKHGVRAALSDLVLVETDHGMDAGVITAVGKIARARPNGAEEPVFSVVRIASKEEMERNQENREHEKEIVQSVKNKVREFNLDMKIVDAEWQFDRSRLSVYFTAPQRVDFRELVKDLARTYKARIELRQIPAREEARRIGGIGPCGLELCCSTFLHDFSQITLDHARVQQLPPNISKLSGMCGRLKCCLLFEIDNYVSALRNYPPLDSLLELPEGRAKMIKVDIFTDTVTAIHEGSGSFISLSLQQVNDLRRAGKVTFAAESLAMQNV